MKKLVFSSICVAALSSSAFAALDLTIETNKPWYEQVISNSKNVNLDTLGWTDGKTAIGKTIGEANAAADNTTIVGSFVTATGSTKLENTYVKSGDDALKVSVKGLTTSNKGEVNATTMIQDYQKVKDQLKLAENAKIIYENLANETDKGLKGMDNSSKKYSLNDTSATQLTNIVNALKDLGVDTANLTADDMTKKRADIATALNGLFGSGKPLNDYASAMADAGADITKLENMKTAIVSDINSLVNAITKPEDKALALHIQSQLNDALAMLDKYTKADELIKKTTAEATKKATDARDNAVKDKFTTSTVGATYEKVATSLTKTTSKEIKDEILGKILTAAKGAMNTDNTTVGNSGAIEKTTKLDGTNKLSLKQAVSYIETASEFATASKEVVGEGKTFADKAAMKKVLDDMIAAIDGKKKIEATEGQIKAILATFKKASDGKDGDSINLSQEMVNHYNKAISTTNGLDFSTVDAANAELDKLLAELASNNSITGTLKTNEINKALGELKSIAPAEAKELAKLFVDGKSGTAITAESIKTAVTTDAEAAWGEHKKENGLSDDSGKDAYIEAYKAQKVAEYNAKIQIAANKIAQTVADSKKDAVMTEALSTLNIQLNNMNKRMGELRGLDGDAGVWLRTWGGKMSNDTSDFTYYSTQLGADKKSSLKGGDLYLGLLTGFDKANSDVKSTSYSFGAYGSYIANNGFFADGVMKFITTSHDRSGYDIANQKSFLASFEGGYRFDLSDAFYVEPSLEFITGRIGEYNSKKDNVTISVDAFSPVVFKPQAFVGGAVDAFTYRAGVGAVLTAKEQTANVEIKDIIADLSGNKLNANGSTKLGKNNHGFVSLGTSYKATENLRINLGLERSFGGDITNDYEVNATVRYGF